MHAAHIFLNGPRFSHILWAVTVSLNVFESEKSLLPHPRIRQEARLSMCYGSLLCGFAVCTIRYGFIFGCACGDLLLRKFIAFLPEEDACADGGKASNCCEDVNDPVVVVAVGDTGDNGVFLQRIDNGKFVVIGI